MHSIFGIFSSCKAESDSADSGSAEPMGEIFVFYPPNGLGDNSYIDSLSYGVHKYAVKNNLLVYDMSPSSMAEAEGLLAEYIPACFSFAEENDTPVLFLFADSSYASCLSAYVKGISKNCNFQR